MSNALVFPGDHGERRFSRLDFDLLSVSERDKLKAAIDHAIATTPGLQVNVEEDWRGIVVRWRTRL